MHTSGGSRFFRGIVGQRLTRAALTRKMKVRLFPILLNNKKGGQIMGCEHKRLKTVGFDWFCADCGEQLDPAVLFGKKEQGQNPPAEEQTGKPTAKKTAAKKAAKKGE